MKQYYKVAKIDGFDFYTGKTINYRVNIGKIVSVPSKSKSKELCSSDVLHASELFFDALSYGELPCSIFIVEGKPVSKQNDKAGFKKLKIIKEIDTTNCQQAYYKFMIWMLEDLKNNYDNKKEIQVTDAINQTIQVFVNAQKTGEIDKSAAWSALVEAWSVRSAAESAVRSAADATVRSATWATVGSVWAAAESVRSAVESAADAVVRSAKKKELSDKFIEMLEVDKN